MNYAGETETDFYTLLGVSRDASTDVIRASYRRLMQQAANHPDLGGDSRIAAQINGAYAVLKDPEKRQFYDARLNLLARIAKGIEVESAPAALDPRSHCPLCGEPHGYTLDLPDDVGCDTCGSPLRVVDTTRINGDDARAVQRLGRALDVQVYTHWEQSKGARGKTEDISPHGLKLTSTIELRPGQRIRVLSNSLDAVGRVTHQSRRNSGWRSLTVAGVSFLTLRILRPVGAFVSRRV